MAKTKFAKFLLHYAMESQWLGQAIASLSSRFMEHDDQAKLAEIAERFDGIYHNIQKTIGDVDAAATVKVSKAEIQAAVKAELPALISSAISEARKTWEQEQAAKTPVTPPVTPPA